MLGGKGKAMAINDIENLSESELEALIKKAEGIKLKMAEEKKKVAMKKIRVIAKEAGLSVVFSDKPKQKKKVKTAG